MVAELNYTTYTDVNDSWERVRRVKNYEEIMGTNIFVK